MEGGVAIHWFIRLLRDAAGCHREQFCDTVHTDTLKNKNTGEETIMVFYKKWWIYGSLVGLLMLSCSRDQLFKYNLHDTYGAGEYPQGEACTGNALVARTADGSCNDLAKPMMGSAGMRMGRNIPIEKTFADEGNLLNPNPRTVSREVLERKNGVKEVGQINYLAAAWIQFMIHDWFDHGDNQSVSPIEVPLEADDPFGTPTMSVGRTRKDPTKNPVDGRPDTFQNVVTAWWDGSQIYGSDQATQDRVRSFVDGKLKMSNGRLPTDARGIDDTGFNKNWWVGLSMFHHLFALEHNAICDRLKAVYPDWNDQKLFDTARLVNTALMAKIHTIEWTPAILKNDILKRAMYANWQGLFPTEGKHSGNVIVHGIMGSKHNHHGVPFSLTEEFTAVYRMHPLLRDTLEVRNHQNNAVMGNLGLGASAFAGATQAMSSYGLTNLFYSFGMSHPGALTTNNFPAFLQNFTMPDGSKVDLAAVDLIRDRERGVPRYNEFRRLVNLKPVNDFTDITPDTALAEKLRTVYNNDIEALDLLVGSLAEGYRPPGYGFGETSFQIFIAMASRRLMSDRFFTDDYRPEIYSPEGMQWIKESGINKVILRHMPNLTTTLSKNTNAFFPWDE